MAEHKKLKMLVKLDDGQTYTLGGDGADNAVTLDTEQTITGLKTFAQLPQSTVEPKADADLITKGYADGHYQPLDTKPHKYDILVKMKHDGSSWVGFSDFSVRLRNGTRLDIKHIENQSATTATQPVKAVFKTVTDLKAPIEAPKQQAATFFDSYKLEAGEFTGTVSFYKAVGSFTPASNDINPWYVYVGSYNANQYDGIYAVSIDNLDKPLLGVNFKFGDAHNGYSYTCLQCGVVFTVDGSALEVAYDGDMANGVEATIEYPINAQSMIGVVTVDTKQDITGEKTFSENIKVTAKPKAANDVATVGYVSGLLNAKAPYDVTLDFKVEDDANGNWVVYSNMEINLDNGKKLKCIHIDNTQPTAASAPVKAIFKAIPAAEAINEYPTEQAPTFFDKYQLQDEEYLGYLTYGHILNSQLQDYSSYKAPFHANQYGTTCTIEEATQLRITLNELPAAVSKVSLKFDGSYLPKTFKASMSGVGMDVTSNVLTNPSGNTPLELLFDVVKLTGLVTLDTAQTITGAKTFEVLPKSEATPKEAADLITKAYLDERCPIPKSELTLKGSLMQYSYHPDRWIVYQDLRLALTNGQHLVPLYIEDTAVDQIKGPIKVVYKFSDAEYVKNAVEKKTKDFLESYKLKENEVLGQIYHAHLLDENAGPHYTNDYVKPFDEIYVGINAHDFNLRPLIKFSFEKLSTPLAKVKLSCSGSYAPKQFQLEWEHENKKFVSKLYTFGQDEFLGSAPLEVQIASAVDNLVTTDTDQTITAVKTFEKLPKSDAVPADANELVNKAYVDAAAKSLKGYEITIFGKTGATNKQLGFKKLKLLFANGSRLYPLYQANDVSLPSETPVPFVWTLDYPNLNSDDPYAMSKSSTDIAKYELRGADFKGSLTTPNKLGSFTIGSDRAFSFGYAFHVYGDTTEKQGVIKFEVLGSLPPITKIELVTDSNTNWQGSAISAEVRTIGGETKASQEVSITGVDQKIELTFEEAFKADPLYVNRFDDQDVFGLKSFHTVPVVYKDAKIYGVGAANTPALFGDLAPGLALPAPEVQAINIGVSAKQTKRKQGMDWVYDFNLSVTLGAMQVKIRRASDLAEEQLYLKAVGPSSNGYRGILTNQQPSSYPNHVVEQMSQENMNAYKLKAGEYFAKLAFASSGRGSISDENWKRAIEQGSDKITALFASSASSFYTGSTTGSKFASSSEAPQAQIWLYIYDCPIVSSWTLQNNSENRSEDYFYIETASKGKSYKQSQFKDAQFAKDIPDVKLQTINLLGAIEALQKTNTALEARIKALEDAAPKP